MLAIGELQKTAGTDKAITAPASIVAATNPSGVTGVWSSWDTTTVLTPTSRTRAERDKRFKEWLLSSPDGLPASVMKAPPLVKAGTNNSVQLLGDGSLGQRQQLKKDDQRISVMSTPVNIGTTKASYAWAVLDESVKSKVNSFSKAGTSVVADNILRAGAPPTDGIAAIEGLDKMTSPTESESVKWATTKSLQLLTTVPKEAMTPFSPDLTVYSRSLFTDPVNGGFKKDLSLAFSQTTNPFGTTPLYKSSNVTSNQYSSDPYWSLLYGYHNLYKKLTNVKTGASDLSGMGVAADVPTSYNLKAAAGATAVTPVLPQDPVLVPTLVRADIIFSLITRDIHGGGKGSGRDNARAAGNKLLHMQYLPVVTLHNPYNVPVSFEGLKVTFKDLPIGMRFWVNGSPVTKSLVPFCQMFTSTENSTSASKTFSFTLMKTVSGGGSMMLEPGQTKIFGTPRVPSSWTWNDEQAGGTADGNNLFDWRNKFTQDFNMGPKLMAPPTSGAGFDVDWLAPKAQRDTASEATLGALRLWSEGLIGVAPSDSLSVEFGPTAPNTSTKSFAVDVSLVKGTGNLQCGAMLLKYGDIPQLTKLVQSGTSLRFPSARTFPETYPKLPADKPIKGADLYEAGTTAVSAYVNPKPFLIFSIAAKTTMESFVPSRTIADSSPLANVADIDLNANKDPIGAVPLEIVMMPIRNGNAAIEENRTNEEAYFFGGNGARNGTPRATFYEIPIAPLQSLAQFRHANLAGSGFMPRVTYTVGESRAHPSIGTAGITRGWTDGTPMIDHTWLANEALWDSCFLSTIADQMGPMYSGSTKTAKTLMTDFFAGKVRLPNQRVGLFNPGLTTVPVSLSAVDGYLKDAAYLALDGGFNVNSTSVDAWVAVLAGLRKASMETSAGMDSGMDATSVMPRVRRPSEKNIDRAPLGSHQLSWQGYRSLRDDEIRSLATQIVAEVRKRGPFLSLADFVNRNPGADDTAVKGAVQAAIDKTTINAMNSSSDGIELTTSSVGLNGYASVEAGIGNSAAGGPGQVSQGDVLSAIGSRITVRSDTFRIRSYGEVRDSTGKEIVSRAWCEAVVQRTPDFVDSSVPSTTAFASSGLLNQKFGRRFEVISFRWLSPDEV
ncbi:hypothetical protein llg_04490 [Luteolibacter sp. LG18]|nr:hypothetical protein llg_04490 [Luteolibacter sp. LG18]